jgi:hypothetical protein
MQESVMSPVAFQVHFLLEAAQTSWVKRAQSSAKTAALNHSVCQLFPYFPWDPKML